MLVTAIVLGSECWQNVSYLHSILGLNTPCLGTEPAVAALLTRCFRYIGCVDIL